ncbi:hypothetical protein C1646_753969 [Rhizophagus diaphanus]|nr:hypothetical protein C1646_753969 [Rhizophagus diaphanus] [Rhizophagus sp. MUCL 43196]
MTSNTNINSDKSEAQLYEVFLYKKKDIIAIQKKLSIDPDRRKGPIENIYQTTSNQSKKGKTLEDSFGLLFDLVGELIDIQEDLNVVDHPILTILYENIQDFDDEISGLEEANKNARAYLQQSTYRNSSIGSGNVYFTEKAQKSFGHIITALD